MIETTQNEIPEYVKNLPQVVQDVVFQSAWESRTMEIAQKYTLNAGQTNALADKVLFILIGLDKPETFLEDIILELNISRLLAEQIMDDLNARVFEYAINIIESKERKVSAEKNNIEQIQTPEIRPDNLPMVEKNEASQVQNASTPRYVPTYKPVSNVPNNLPTGQADFAKEMPVEKKSEVFQRPSP